MSEWPYGYDRVPPGAWDSGSHTESAAETARRDRETREEELATIAKAKAIEAERKHQAELAWAKRILEDDRGAPKAGRIAIPRRIQHAVWQRDGAKCTECGSSQGLEFDHVIPFAMGGGNTERNLQLLCESCNRRKGKSLG